LAKRFAGAEVDPPSAKKCKARVPGSTGLSTGNRRLGSDPGLIIRESEQKLADLRSLLDGGFTVLTRSPLNFALVLATFALGLFVGNIDRLSGGARAEPADRVFELRTYTTLPGRLDALHARFADHTIRLFEKHGMTNIGYFTPRDTPLADNTLIYLLAHDSREAADASWAAFFDDPEWKQAAADSERDGKILEKVERTFLDPTAYSQMK